MRSHTLLGLKRAMNQNPVKLPDATAENANGCTPIRVRATKVGEYVKRQPYTATVYIRGAYDRATRMFSLVDAEDMNREIFISADKILWVGFTY